MSIIATIGAFIPGLFGKKLSYKVARTVGIVVLAVALIVALGVGKCAYDNSVIEDHEVKREAAASGAREDAADQRVKDALDNANSEKELQDVIQNAPGGTLSPAAHALACERLHRYGRIPPSCGPSGGDGSQARPD